MRASVVLPHPGGPHRMNENSSFFSIATRNGLSLPVRCSCPTNSSSFVGRIREARGSMGEVYASGLLSTLFKLAVRPAGGILDSYEYKKCDYLDRCGCCHRFRRVLCLQGLYCQQTKAGGPDGSAKWRPGGR